MCSSVLTRSHDVMSASTEFLSLRQVRCSAARAPPSKPGKSKSAHSAQRLHDVRPGIMQTKYTAFEQTGQRNVAPGGYTFESSIFGTCLNPSRGDGRAD